MRRVAFIMGVLAFALVTVSRLAHAAKASAYERFSQFCIDSFGAEKEPLVYERLGGELSQLPGSEWVHASVHSACVAWSTTLPASTVVEYGTTAGLGLVTAGADRAYYTHVHTLRGLEPGTTYHYRMAGVDERGRRWASPVRTFETDAGESMTRIERLPGSGPYRIATPGRYLVTADLVADHSAFVIEADDVTLDLGGHTITYNQRKMPRIDGDDHNVWFDKAPHGVHVAKRNLRNVRVVNGTIVQGDGGDGAQANGRGANPVAVMSGCSGEIAGVTIRWHGDQVVGFCMLWVPPIDLHHNVAVDLGTAISNRHQGVAAIQSVPRPHHNLIQRTRHRGIDVADGGEVYCNEVYVDSMATNASGIGGYKARDVVIRDNRVFGGGYLAIGIGIVSQGTRNVRVHGNLVHLQAAAPSTSWAEYGDQSGAYGFRITWGGENIDCHDNTFITNGRDGGMVRGIWYCPDDQQRHNVIRNNVVKAIAQNDATDLRGAIVISGAQQPVPDHAVLIEGNRIISNFCHVLLGEPYGAGHSARFVDNTFERVGELDRYRFVQIGHGSQVCTGSSFIDNRYVGDARIDAVRWEGDEHASRSFDVGWTLTLHAVAGTWVAIADATGREVVNEQVGQTGVFRTTLVQTRYENGKAIPSTPHTITMTDGDRTTRRQIRIDRPIHLDR